LVLKA
jgi:hypothetical protein